MAWVVVDSEGELITGEQILGNYSAQIAELIAFTKALEWGKGKRINVHADSRILLLAHFGAPLHLWLQPSISTTSPWTRKEPDIAETQTNDRMYTNVTRSITIGHHELTPYRDVSIVEAGDLGRSDEDQRTHRYVQKGLSRIPHLWADWEGLKKEAMQIDHLWNKERELIKTHAEKAEELFKSQNFFSRIWN
ncbi:hypothetical protein scyTo_0021024 [Scyliorhinus torazame]|uniref:RNase H type-1 domain-containing protein n=1 Tax=Scyliorhinus torazame TaxID=75743 RepID=A0A401PU66_SCYTO|nr:hypothetical protein [Scyliorhinus torazame]